VQSQYDLIIKNFPWPVGVELRRLFSGSMRQLDRMRLDQIFKTIERSMQFLSFVMLSHACRLSGEGALTELLEPVIRTCSRKESEQALELLAKAYVEKQDIGKADSVASAMLNRFPHYELNEQENFESYNRLIKRYHIHPEISIGVRNTALYTFFNTTKVFTLPDGPSNTEPYDPPGYSFMYYGWGEIEFNRGISINGDLVWWTSWYSRSLVMEDEFDIYYSENREFIEIPLYLKKYFFQGKNLLPYITGGLGWSYMTKAWSYASKKAWDDDIWYSDDNIQVMSMRNRHTFEWLAGAGIGYKIKNIRMFLDVRYYGGLNSLTDESHRYDNQLLQEEYFYIDNSVKMNKFELGASISYTLKNSVKKIKY